MKDGNAGKGEGWRHCCSWSCTKAFILKNFLPLGFALSIVWMLVWPWPGEKIDKWRVANYGIVETCMIIIIFFISGVVLKTEELVNAIHHPGPLLWGLVAILGITPCIGFLTIRLPLEPREFPIGLTVFAVGPTTLAQGQTLVAQAGGNTALALLLLVSTNIIAVFTTPFWVQAILASRGGSGHVSLQPANLLINLVVTILAPSLVGKLLREAVPPVARWVSAHRTFMSLANNGSLIVIVWIQLCAAHDRLMQQPFKDIVVIICCAVLLHFVFVAINWPMVRLFRFPPREAVAALVMGSQKTMPFAVTIIALLPASLGAKGLLTLPPLVSQISQLFCDVWIGAHFRHKIEAEKKAKEAKEALPTSAVHGGKAPGSPTGTNGHANAAATQLAVQDGVSKQEQGLVAPDGLQQSPSKDVMLPTAQPRDTLRRSLSLRHSQALPAVHVGSPTRDPLD